MKSKNVWMGIIIFCFCLFFPFNAKADTVKMHGIYKYECKGSKVAIVGLDVKRVDKENIYHLEIPEKIDGKKVTGVHLDWELDLDTVEMYIEEVTIPRYVKEIDINNVTGLEKYIVSANNPYFLSEDGILYNKSKTILLRCPRAKYGKIKIPSGVKKIQEKAFFGCCDIVEIYVPDSVKNIGVAAFYGCNDMKAVHLPKTLTKIASSTFLECEKIKKIVIPKSVKSIGYQAFMACENLQSITIPQNVTSIGQYAFADCKQLKKIKFAQGSKLKEVKAYTFDKCRRLTFVEIPDGAEKIGKYAFQDCDRLKEIGIPVSVNYIHKKAFSKYDKYAGECGNSIIRGICIKTPKDSYAYKFAEKYNKYGFTICIVE